MRNSLFFIRYSRKSGFTLIELLITLSIIAILASVSAVNFLGYRNKNRIKLTGDEISSLLRTVHDRAVSQEEGSSWGVHFVNNASNSEYYYVVFYGNGIPPVGTTSTIKHLDKSLKFLKPTDDNTTTTIFRQLNGNLSNTSPINIQVSMKSDSTSSTTINVYPNGRVEN